PVEVQQSGLEGRPVGGASARMASVRRRVEQQELRQRPDAGILPGDVLSLVQVRRLERRANAPKRIRRIGLVAVLGEIYRELPVYAIGGENPVEALLETGEIGKREEVRVAKRGARREE